MPRRWAIIYDLVPARRYCAVCGRQRRLHRQAAPGGDRAAYGDYIEGMESITVCPITSVLSTASVRVRLKASEETGLKETSEVETDKITTIRATRLSGKIGRVAEKELNKIDYALRVWLDL